MEITDALVPPRALPQSQLTALVTLQSYGYSGGKARLSVRDGGKVLASRDVTIEAMGSSRPNRWFSIAAMAGPQHAGNRRRAARRRGERRSTTR